MQALQEPKAEQTSATAATAGRAALPTTHFSKWTAAPQIHSASVPETRTVAAAVRPKA